MSEESIIEELLAENAELRSRIESEDVGSIFHILSLRPMKIAGVLISEGVWKGIKYSYDKVLKPALNKFKGLKGLVMHGKTEEFKDRVIGEITKVGTDDILKAITFEAVITDEDAIKKIQEGVFDAVSVKGKFEDIDTSVTPPEGINYTPIEWSLTGTPACKNCLIFNKEELSLNIEKDINQDGLEEVKVKEMEEEFEVKDGDVLVLPDNWDELEDFSEVEAEVMPFEELAKKKAKKKIVRVPKGKYPKIAKKIIKYFGCPFPFFHYPFYYYYYPYYPDQESEDIGNLLDVLPLAEDYKTFMKNCMNEKKDIKDVTSRMKACALEWKQVKEKKEEEIKEEEEVEMAEFKCPACGEVSKSKAALAKHWDEQHKEEYGEYGKVKKLVKNRELVNNIRRVFSLEEEGGESEAKEEVKKEEEKVQHTEGKEEVKEEAAPKETEEKKQITTEEPSKPSTPEEPKPLSLKEIYAKIEKTPRIAAELLLASVKKEEEEF